MLSLAFTFLAWIRSLTWFSIQNHLQWVLKIPHLSWTSISSFTTGNSTPTVPAKLLQFQPLRALPLIPASLNLFLRWFVR